MERLCSRCQTYSDTGKSYCRKCHAAYCREWTKQNRDSRGRSAAKYYAANRPKIRDWQERNKEKLQQDAHARYMATRRVAIARSKAQREEWQRTDPEGYRADHRRRVKAWRAANPERAKVAQRTRENRKWRTDARYRTSRLIANMINQSLHRNGAGGKHGLHWELLVGYTCGRLVDRLKETLPTGHSWQDFLAGKLHIDHIIPVTAFNFRSADDSDFKRCWALSNLQLLPAEQNRRKSDKLSEPFQPGLAFG